MFSLLTTCVVQFLWLLYNSCFGSEVFMMLKFSKCQIIVNGNTDDDVVILFLKMIANRFFCGIFLLHLIKTRDNGPCIMIFEEYV